MKKIIYNTLFRYGDFAVLAFAAIIVMAFYIYGVCIVLDFVNDPTMYPGSDGIYFSRSGK